MSFFSDKVRKYWFPFIILMIIVLAAAWILAGVIYPNNVQGIDQDLAPTIPATPSQTPTSSTTPSPTPTVTSTPTDDGATATPTKDCTYSAYYWYTNPDAWLIENLLLGNLSYTKEQAIEIMALEDPTPTEKLMGQFFAALLNILNGADSSEIDQTMIKARDWLILRPHGIDLSEAQIAEIEGYTQELQDYNEGLTGPGACPDEPRTPTPGPTDTLTPTLTNTPGAQPYFTATPTQSSGGRPRPTNTQPPPPPTNTPPPAPSNTPAPTPTTVVPPTPAPTKPPPTQSTPGP